MTNDRAAQSFKDVCQFCDTEEDSIITTLKVLHSSYALTTSNVQALLKRLKENVADTVFPKLQKYATLPDTTASVECSFSKLKHIMHISRSVLIPGLYLNIFA